VPGAAPPVTARAPGGASRWANLRSVLAVALRSPSFVIALVILAFWIFDALAWHLFAPFDPLAQTGTPLLKPSGGHLLGTDSSGRDILSRVLAGASSVLAVAPVGTAIGIICGTVVGLVTGFYRGVADTLIMRVVDALLALPAIILAALALSLLGTSEFAVALLIGVIFTPVVARTVRSAVLTERDAEYVAAARLRGESGLYIMAAEILPNVTAPILVEATVRLGYAIFMAATLSFLSLGIQPPSPDWGLTIATERTFISVQPWTVLGPAIALGTLVVAVSLVSDGLRKAINS
ncbi:MAG: ABC transporter permease, partial [Nocardiopsaceae bacterium]|nr:ABC transporter permease [Nocardiopsaceae bacterium]